MSEMARRFAVNTPWTDEMVEALKVMIAAGKTFTEMASALNVTRGAVASKIYSANMSAHSLWTDKVVATLTELWADKDISAALIAHRLSHKFGVVISRNAILGKAHRLGLPSRREASPSKKRRVPTLRKPPAPRKRIVEPKLAANAIVDINIPFVQRRSLLELTSKTCKWPVGDPHEPGFFFCGAEPVEGCVYCAGHMARAYQKPAARKSLQPFHGTGRRAA
jgi:GcrA cell cycle regulator